MDLATSIITNTITVGKLLNPEVATMWRLGILDNPEVATMWRLGILDNPEVATMWRLGILDIPSTSCNTIGKVLFPEVARLGMLAVTNAKLYCSFRSQQLQGIGIPACMHVSDPIKNIITCNVII